MCVSGWVVVVVLVEVVGRAGSLSLLFTKSLSTAPHFEVSSVRGLLSAKVPNSLFEEAHSVLLPEPTHMEDEDEDQENEMENERDGEECKVES